MKKQHKWLIICLLLVGQVSARAQPGGWSVDATRYQYNMTAVAQIRINGVPNHLLNNYLAVFCDGQIRGYATPVKSGGQAYYFLNLYSNVYKDEVLYFRAYLGSTGKVYESASTLLFKHHKAVGKLTTPYQLNLTLSERPLIYSLSEVNYMENTCSDVLNVEASDNVNSEGSGLHYSLSGGADQGKFSIHPQSGLLKWATGFIPDFEAPGDANGDNRYELKVRITDATSLQDEQNVTVTVVKPAPPPALICPVNRSITTSGDGTGNCNTMTFGLSVPAATLCASYNLSYQLTGATSSTGNGQVPVHQIFEKGTTLVAYTRSGVGAAQCSFTVTVSDDEVPGIACSPNLVRGTDAGLCSAVVAYTVSGSDNCPGVATAHVSGGTSGTAFPKGITTVQWKSTDAAAWTKTCTFTVTVNDTELPLITCPANIMRGTDPNLCSAVVTYATPTFSDNCPNPVLAYSSGGTSGSAFPKGLTTVQWKATDGAGLTRTCTFTVTVNDVQAPSISCPANIAKNTDLNVCSAVTTYANAQFSDNCPGATLTLMWGLQSGSAFPKGITTLIWQTTDAVGETASCTFTITVNDPQAPTISCPANIVRNTDLSQCTAVVTYTTPVFSDNCPGVSVLRTSPAGTSSGSTFPKGATTVAWRATDAAGASVSCSFTITVNDAQTPTITCPVNQSKTTDANLCTAVVTYPTPVFTDNCVGVTAALLSGPASGSAFQKGVTTVTWKATDGTGLIKTCTFTVTVTDGQLPTITCPANIAANTDPNQCTALVTYALPVASDNCTGITLSLTSGGASGSAFAKGQTTVTWKATDGAGLTKTCTFRVTVNDLQAPAIICPANLSITAAPGQCSAVVTYSNPSATDNCAVQSNTLLSGLASASVFPQGVTTNVWRATDNSGLTKTCAFTVTVACGTSPEGSNNYKLGTMNYELGTMNWEPGTKNYEPGTMNYEPGTRNEQDSSFIVHRSSFNLVPNPAATEVLITVDGLDGSGGLLTVFSMQGRVVWQQQLDPEINSEIRFPRLVTQRLNVSDFPSGIYQLQLITPLGVASKSLVVRRL